MAVSFRVLGTGFYHDFDESFDLISMSRDNQIPTQSIVGRDGAFVDADAVRRDVTIHTLSGTMRGATVAAARTLYDEMMAAINNIKAGEVFLVDIALSRRIPVRLISANIPREPARTFVVTLVFQSSETPFWSDLNVTNASLASGRILDLSTGDAPSELEMTIKGNIANPTVVLGNWSFQWNGAVNTATAINTNATGRPYGSITDAGVGGHTIVRTPLGFGRIPHLVDIFFSELYHRTDKFTFLTRFMGFQTWPTAVDNFLWSLTSDTQTEAYRLRIEGTSGDLRLETAAGPIIEVAGPAFVENRMYTLSGFVDTAGTVIGATTYFAKLYLDGVETGSTTVAPSGITAGTIFRRLRLGANHSGGGQCEQVLTHQYMWHANLGTEFCKQIGLSNRILQADNKTWKWAETVQAGQHIFTDHDRGRVSERITTAGGLSLRMAPFTGDFFRLNDSNAISKTKTQTAYMSVPMTIEFTYTKHFY